jgi:membrane protein DedA with SNARE-associated domain
VHKVLAAIAAFVTGTISALGYAGIGLLMAIESACIPLPSEVIMPFSGYLVFTGRFNLWLTGLAGAIGCVIGSLVGYWMGVAGGRPLVERYGRYVLMSHHDLDLAERLFAKYGEPIIFVSRLLPVVRTFISFPAGIARMNIGRFCLYTFLGSFPWCVGLAYFGMRLGEKWDSLKVYFHRFDAVIVAVVVLCIIWWVRRHLKQNAQHESDPCVKLNDK